MVWLLHNTSYLGYNVPNVAHLSSQKLAEIISKYNNIHRQMLLEGKTLANNSKINGEPNKAIFSSPPPP